MKRGYKYEKEMLHWLDGGEIEVRYRDEPWEPFDGQWVWNIPYYWEYRIAEPDLSRNVLIGLTDSSISPAEKQKEERWLYVHPAYINGMYTVRLDERNDGNTAFGKIRMEDV